MTSQQIFTFADILWSFIAIIGFLALFFGIAALVCNWLDDKFAGKGDWFP